MRGGRTTLRPNPILGSLFARDVLPFVPVWLFGVVLAASLDYFKLVGNRLPLGSFYVFVTYYSVLVVALALVGFYRHYRDAPQGVDVTPQGILATYGAGGETSSRDVLLAFPDIRSIYLSGFSGPHLEARTRTGWRSFPLTAENARSVADAWTAWRGRAGQNPTPA